MPTSIERLVAVSSLLLAVLCRCVMADAETLSLAKRDSVHEPLYPWTFDNDLFGVSTTFLSRNDVGGQSSVGEMFSLLSTICLYPMCSFGPDFWGLMSREWRLCRLGRVQSPVNIDPRRLLFDPHLSPLAVAQQSIEANFRNTGQFPVLTTLMPNALRSNGVSDLPLDRSSGTNAATVNISGGPAFPYNYQLNQVVVHFGRALQPPSFDGGGTPSESNHYRLGSEHTIDQVRYPAEIQLLAYNSDLYENFSQAISQPRGLLAIAIIVDIGKETNPELRRLVTASQSITYKHRETRIRRFDAAALLPLTEHFVTYDGSLTFPGCQEGVIWVVMNSPIYITKEDLKTLNQMQQHEEKDDAQQPLPMSGNFRPLRPLNGRLVRTNINVKYKSRVAGSCPSNIYLNMGYRINPQRANRSDMTRRVDAPKKIGAEEAAKGRKTRNLKDGIGIKDENSEEKGARWARTFHALVSDTGMFAHFLHDDESGAFEF